jgi:hypothetical protein
MIPIAESTNHSEPGIADMKSFQQFLSESINIAGDFNGTMIVGGNVPQQEEVGESFTADVLWKGNLFRMEMITKDGLPSSRELTEQLQNEYPGAVVQQIYPQTQNSTNIKNVKRYHPSKLEWID